jgi:exodeoxyribonuclease VII large subunit
MPDHSRRACTLWWKWHRVNHASASLVTATRIPRQGPVSGPWARLCRAVADALEARFNPVTVRGEITGFSRAASGHCYFSLKDAQGQIRCAMFRRAASLLDFSPRDGELVEVRGRLGVYEPRGDLQLVVESLRRAGQGALFEQFLRLKAKLEAEGLFDSERKRPLPLLPRGRHRHLAGRRGAARRGDLPAAARAAHAGGAGAGRGAGRARRRANWCARCSRCMRWPRPAVDVILLVRGGGSIEDLWAFNDEQLARTIVQPARCRWSAASATRPTSPSPTSAPTCARRRPPPRPNWRRSRATWLGALDCSTSGCRTPPGRSPRPLGQRLDQAAAHLGRPSAARRSSSFASSAPCAAAAPRAAVAAQRWRRCARSIAARASPAVASAWHAAARAPRALALRLQAARPAPGAAARLCAADRRARPADRQRTQRRSAGQAQRAALADGEVDRHAVSPTGTRPTRSSRILESLFAQPNPRGKNHGTRPPPLPYPIDALAPDYSKETLEYHHGKHHNAYVVNLNNLQKGTEFENMTLEDIIKKSSGGIYNNSAQIWNHTFFWNCMKPQGGGEPTGALARPSPPSGAATPPSRKPSSSRPSATSARAGPGW